MQRTPEQLRKEAADLRFAASHADRVQDAEDELQRAAELERQANVLEHGDAPVAPKEATPAQWTPEERAADQRARVNRAMGQMEQMLGMKP